MTTRVDTRLGSPTDLLSVGELKATRKGIPLMVEFRVNRETGPFLVTSTRAFLWVTPRQDQVRAATRVLSIPSFYMEIVREICDTGMQAEWDNVHPLTREGILACIEHLRFYGITELDILVPQGEVYTWVGVDDDVTFYTADWLEPGHVVVVPSDREYLGFVTVVPNGLGLAVVHNASRAMAVARSLT